MKVNETPDANRIATDVAGRCSEFKADGRPKAPARYAVIWQAARLGAIAALSERQNVPDEADKRVRDAAPELLAAAESALAIVNGARNEYGEYPAWVNAADELSAAIAKAEGGAA